MTDTAYLGSETVPADGYLQPRRVRVYFRCDLCGHEWNRIYKAIPRKDPSCPKTECKAAAQEEEINRRAENMARIISEQRAPGHIGDKPMNKVIDRTAEIVMEDYRLTDLKDNIREGESMAPKLRPDMQKAADNFFAKKPAENTLIAQRVAAGARRFASSAIKGNYGHLGGVVLPPGRPGESPLTRVKTEKLRSA